MKIKIRICWEEVEEEVVGKARAGVRGRRLMRKGFQGRQMRERSKKKYKLIELVREHPCLYDTAHPEHLNKSVTAVLWAEIAAVFEEDGKHTTSTC